MNQIPEESLQQIEHYFHELMKQRAGGFIAYHNVELPKLEFNVNQDKQWFPIPGMYGGFSYWWEQETLITESWCRVVGGSGQRHKITTQGFELLEEGFV
jgi:hypothetical protein